MRRPHAAQARHRRPRSLTDLQRHGLATADEMALKGVAAGPVMPNEGRAVAETDRTESFTASGPSMDIAMAVRSMAVRVSTSADGFRIPLNVWDHDLCEHVARHLRDGRVKCFIKLIWRLGCGRLGRVVKRIE